MASDSKEESGALSSTSKQAEVNQRPFPMRVDSPQFVMLPLVLSVRFTGYCSSTGSAQTRTTARSTSFGTRSQCLGWVRDGARARAHARLSQGFQCGYPTAGSRSAAPEENEAIEPNKPREELRQEPYPMPNGFEWSQLDITSTEQLEEMYTLLNENYVEDDDNMFRFDYSIPFLQARCNPTGSSA